jgi:hypothetical protein
MPSPTVWDGVAPFAWTTCPRDRGNSFQTGCTPHQSRPAAVPRSIEWGRPRGVALGPGTRPLPHRVSTRRPCRRREGSASRDALSARVFGSPGLHNERRAQGNMRSGAEMAQWDRQRAASRTGLVHRADPSRLRVPGRVERVLRQLWRRYRGRDRQRVCGSFRCYQWLQRRRQRSQLGRWCPDCR